MSRPSGTNRARDSKSSEPVSKGAESASARTPPKPPADADDPDHYLSPSRAEQQALSARKRRESEERLQSVVAGRVAAEALNRSAAIQRPKLKKRESLEGLHGTGRVSQLRDSHAETWRASEKARADDELATSLRGTGRVSRLGAAHMANWAKGESLGPGQGRGRSSNVDSIVSLFESAVQRHRDTKAVALSTKPRTRNSVKLVATMPTPLADAIALAKAQEWAVDDALADAPKPMFANVSDSAFKLVVQIAAADPERHHLEFCVLSNGCRDEPEWESVDAPTVCLEITEPGTHMIVSRSVDKVTRQVMTLPAHAVFETALPDVVKSAAHEHTLELVEPPSHEPICDGCTKQIPNGASHYKCNEQACGAFALCIDCALAVGPAGSGALAGEAKKEKRRSSVALSVGAKRLWLSEDVAFGGSSEAISDASLELVDQIAAVLCAHPHLDGIIIEGHTNSKCGLECDGSMQCSNNTCHRHFGANGGAVAFSLRRADAVKAALVARGVDADRLVARGLAGQRRLVDDTEAEDNHRNRRVEVHLHDADDDDEDDFEVAGKLVDLKLEEGAEYDDDDAEYDDDEGAEYDNEGAEYDEGAENELPQDEAGPMHDEAAEYEDEPPPPPRRHAPGDRRRGSAAALPSPATDSRRRARPLLKAPPAPSPPHTFL
ncbi:hypothetical protein M885DRAFT_531264 [Pelagophyceae sp. CCMP2097]|nr:hypothetical protein M885DRAFT_531264 [Pelagophyceae sp. CCMP2097]